MVELALGAETLEADEKSCLMGQCEEDMSPFLEKRGTPSRPRERRVRYGRPSPVLMERSERSASRSVGFHRVLAEACEARPVVVSRRSP